MQIVFNSYTGKFSYRLSAKWTGGEIDEDTLKVSEPLLLEGLANLAYRFLSSKVDKALREKGLLGSDAPRKELEYSSGAARTIETVVDEAIEKMDGGWKGWSFKFEITGEHVIGDGAAPMARATNLVNTFLGTPMEANYRLLLGEGDRDELIRKAHSMGLGIDLPRKGKVKTASVGA